MVNKAIKEYTPDIHALRVTALTNSEAGKDCWNNSNKNENIYETETHEFINL